MPANYIPAAVSTMKNLEDAIVKAVDHIPEVAASVLQVTTQIARLLDDVEGQKLPQNAASTLARVNEVLGSVDAAMKQLDTRRLSQKAQAALANLDGTISRANGMIAHIDGATGLLASAQRATGAVGDVANGARGLGQQMEETLRDVQEVSAAIQRVSDALERDPDMLLKGRSRAK